jgi:hypothetical protein
MHKYAKIGKLDTANTKITFILLFDFILPIFESIQKSSKIVHIENRIFWIKFFFFKKVNTSNFSQFQGLFNAKNLKK